MFVIDDNNGSHLQSEDIFLVCTLHNLQIVDLIKKIHRGFCSDTLKYIRKFVTKNSFVMIYKLRKENMNRSPVYDVDKVASIFFV